VIVDLSYQSDWKTRDEEDTHSQSSSSSSSSSSSWWTKRLLDQYKKQHQLPLNNDSNSNTIFKVDVSSCGLGNSNNNSNNDNNDLQQWMDAMMTTIDNQEIQLDMRMNQLSSVGASFLLDFLSSSPQPPQEIENDATKKSLLVSSLDIGLNDLGYPGPDVTNDAMQRQEQQRSFAKSIRTFIESPNCPSTLRMDSCGIGPPTCRAIGKVRTHVTPLFIIIIIIINFISHFGYYDAYYVHLFLFFF